VGRFPPEHSHFCWQAALQHGGLRLFEWELSAAAVGLPGDWDRARRMLQAGVSFAFLDELVCDYFPAKAWQPDEAEGEA